MIVFKGFLIVSFFNIFRIQGNDDCFDFPILILTPDDPLPTMECYVHDTFSTYHLPSEDCMKRKVEGTLRTLNNGDKPNCIKDYLNTSLTTIYNNITVNYRGSSSLNFGSKHQMALKLKEEETLLDLPAEKSWVLNGPWIDGSLLRNHLGHWLYRSTGRYSPRTKHFILFLEDPTTNFVQYHGMYLLIEHITVGKNRLGLAKNDIHCNEKEMNGGWAWQYNPLKYGSYSPNIVPDSYFLAFGMSQRPVLEYPNKNDLNQKMRNYFVDTSTGFIPQYYRYLFNNMTSDPDGISKHIDEGSFADYILHTELSLNQDAYRRSVWFFKDRDQPINAGPVWDLNLAYGIGAATGSKNWMIDRFSGWKRLRCNYRVASLMIQRWKVLRSGNWSDRNITSFIQKASEPIDNMLQKCVNNMWKSNFMFCVLVSNINAERYYNESVDHLLNSVLDRAKWIDDNINGVYQQLNDSYCVGIGNYPKFNCAANTSDGSCLMTNNVNRYAFNVSMPDIHKPYEGRACSESVKDKNKPSIDPCWFSVGSDPEHSYLTPFCSGFGHCLYGANSTCICNKLKTDVVLDPKNCSFPGEFNRTYLRTKKSNVEVDIVFPHKKNNNEKRKESYGSLSKQLDIHQMSEGKDSLMKNRNAFHATITWILIGSATVLVIIAFFIQRHRQKYTVTKTNDLLISPNQKNDIVKQSRTYGST